MKLIVKAKTRTKPVISFAPGLYEKMASSVGRLPPENYALLAGFLNNPFYVVDFMPLPPMMDGNSRVRSSSASVTLNGPFIEYYLNTVLLPAGMYPLGAIHSHPGDMDVLSRGVEGSGQGDIPSMRSHLEAAKRLGKPWHNYLAPIVTHPGESPQITGYIVRLDSPEPIAADVAWHVSAGRAGADAENSKYLLNSVTPQQVIDRANPWQTALAELERNQSVLPDDREYLQKELRHYRDEEMASLRKENEARLKTLRRRRSLTKLGFSSHAS